MKLCTKIALLTITLALCARGLHASQAAKTTLQQESALDPCSDDIFDGPDVKINAQIAEVKNQHQEAQEGQETKGDKATTDQTTAAKPKIISSDHPVIRIPLLIAKAKALQELSVDAQKYSLRQRIKYAIFAEEYAQGALKELEQAGDDDYSKNNPDQKKKIQAEAEEALKSIKQALRQEDIQETLAQVRKELDKEDNRLFTGNSMVLEAAADDDLEDEFC